MKRNLKKVLWAFDGSKESEDALRWATLFSHSYGAKIAGVYINQISVPVTYLNPDFVNYYYEFAQETAKHLKQRMENFKSELLKENIKLNVEIHDGEASEKLVEIAGSYKADLIVMGKRGQSLLSRLFVGSTTLKVLRSSHINVLSVKSKPNGETPKISKILTPVDLEDNAFDLIKYSIELANKFNSEIALVNVFWIDSQVYNMPYDLVEESIKNSEHNLDKTLNEVLIDFEQSEIREIRNRIKTRVLHGPSPGVTIADYSNNKGFDLIVISSKFKNVLEKIFLGSVAEKIIQGSKCSVLVLKSNH